MALLGTSIVTSQWVMTLLCVHIMAVLPLVTGGDRSFRKMAPTLWNALPDLIAVAETLTSFKSALKTHLFRKCF